MREFPPLLTFPPGKVAPQGRDGGAEAWTFKTETIKGVETYKRVGGRA